VSRGRTFEVVAAVALIAATGCHRRGPKPADDAGAGAGGARHGAAGPGADVGSAPPPGPVALGPITVRTDEDSLDPDQLGRTLRAGLVRTPGFVAADRPGLAARVELTVAATVRPAAAGRPAMAVVACEAQVRWRHESSEPAPHAHVAASRELDPGQARHPDAAIKTLARDVVAAAARDLATREAERTLPAGRLAPLLGSSDEQEVLWGLELAGARRARALIPMIAPLLRGSPPVHDAAITALVAIGDPSAVSAIASSVDFEDRAQLETAIEAAVALGGTDAREFLELIATGHHDPDLAARARNGLRRLAQRDGGAQ
jgi:hypothetical protein